MKRTMGPMGPMARLSAGSAHLLFFNSTLAHGQLDLAADDRQAKVGRRCSDS